MTYLLFAKKFGPYIAIVALLLVALMIRGDKIKANAQRDMAVAETKSLRKVNEENAQSLASLNASRKDNDRIQEGMSKDIAAIKLRGTKTIFQLREVYRNDPAVRSWADTPVPDSVRAVLKGTAAGQVEDRR